MYKSKLIISLISLVFHLCLSAQVYSPRATVRTVVGADSLFLYKSWDLASVCASARQESHFQWYSFNYGSLSFDHLVKETVGIADTVKVNEMCGLLCKITTDGIVSEKRVWCNVPTVDSVSIHVDSIDCEATFVRSIAYGDTMKVYDSAKSSLVAIPQSFVYNWYTADTLQTTSVSTKTVLESPMSRSQLKVVAVNQVDKSVFAVDTVESYGVKALFSYSVRERDVDNEITNGDSYSAPAEISFVNNSKGNYSVSEWVIGSLSRLFDKSPVYSFQQSGTYDIKLIVTDEDTHCTSVDSTLHVTITDAFLDFPNVFTPNGDGVNDEFRPAYRSLKSYTLTIYNKWGRKVYHTTDPSTGWNGKIGNSDAAEGVYMFVAEGDGFDKGVRIRRHGSVTLVR